MFKIRNTATKMLNWNIACAPGLDVWASNDIRMATSKD